MYFNPFFFVAVGLSVLYAAMLLYFLTGWLRLKKIPKDDLPPGSDLPFVSIIIPARNESEHIKACLESIFKQSYPKDLFEVILVDDFSTDPTIRLAKEIEEPNLLVLDLQNYLSKQGEHQPNKKKAITLGIKNAKGELIVTTDGDCTFGEHWLISMVNYYKHSGCKMLTGPVMIKPARWPLAIFQQLDIINLVGITGATIRNGVPTMCNGANLMYGKELFHEVEGFKGNNDIPTGDDIFLMQKIQARYPGSIAFAKDFDACVFTRPENGLGNFMSQRIRWVSKSTRFSDGRVLLILIFAYLFNLFILVAILMAFQPEPMSWLPLAVVGGSKLFFDWLFNIPVTAFFRKLILLLLFPVIDALHVGYVLVVGLFGLNGKYRWKGRLVHR